MGFLDKDRNKINVLLEEYQACHRNRNHYDSLRWTIGSIFIATSLALFGLSFGRRFEEIFVIAIFSYFLILIWYLYSQHVNPYVMSSIKRFHEIELELWKMGFDTKLHKSIAEIRQERGVNITLFLFSAVFALWILRIFLSWLENIAVIGYYGIASLIAYSVLLIPVFRFHRMSNVRNWRAEIDEIIKKREKYRLSQLSL